MLKLGNRLVTLCSVAVLVVTTAGIGCDDGDSTATKQSAPTQGAPSAQALPADLVLKEAPAGARDVVALKKEAKEGDAVVLRGRVGGSPSPFVENRAVVQVVDLSLKACGEGNPDDKCETPWDFCCEVPKVIAEHSASVQVVGADGRPMHSGLKGVGGLKPLAEVTVTGTVANSPAGGLLINATGLHVKQ